MTLGESLPMECARVRELVVMYNDPMLNGSGRFAAALMEQSLKAADEAMISGDVVAMIKAQKDLEEYSA